MPTLTQIRSAKVAAWCTLALALIGPLSLMVVPSQTVVAGDAEATAALQVASPSLVRLGLAGELAIVTVELVMTVALYRLFRPLSAGLAAVAALARLVMVAIQSVGAIAGFAALSLFLQGHAPSSAAVLLELEAAGSRVWQAIFGLHCGVLAALILRSRLVPRTLGLLMAIAAIAYATLGLGTLMLPERRELFESVPLTLAMLGEVPFFLWLLFAGLRTGTHRRRSRLRRAARA